MKKQYYSVNFFHSISFFQTLVFNNLYLFGFINPMVYILFLVIYRFDYDQTFLIISSFILGFSIDFFHNQEGLTQYLLLQLDFLDLQ